MPIELTSLRKAVEALERSLLTARESPGLDNLEPSVREAVKAGVIKHFEVAYEQSWKFMQRWLRENAAPNEAEYPRTRKDLFRMAARYGLISDPEPWFVFADARNISTHTYDEYRADEVYLVAGSFLPHVSELLDNLKKIND
mgnify:CR=1 FL=1